ncbi:MAG TPA: hypothetical protein VK745_11695 [Polyangiaceae bacterium]|nr:hypothetical protein [Polyangiaceae bacterium]
MAASSLALEAAEARHAGALVDLFARTGTPCHCQYWHFGGDKNAWLDRLFHAPEQNREAFIAGLQNEELKGVVALAEGQAVGWMKLCSAERVPKLYQQRLYKGLHCFAGARDGVLTVGCMLSTKIGDAVVWREPWFAKASSLPPRHAPAPSRRFLDARNKRKPLSCGSDPPRSFWTLAFAS